MKRLLALLILLGASFPAHAQSPVITYPYAVTSSNYSSSVSVTNTFKSILAANATGSRRGCLVQNAGTNPMYVYFGPIASATTASSLKITAGQYASCNIGGLVLQDQVSITGTASELYYAIQQ